MVGGSKLTTVTDQKDSQFMVDNSCKAHHLL